MSDYRQYQCNLGFQIRDERFFTPIKAIHNYSGECSFCDLENAEIELTHFKTLLKEAVPWIKDYELFVGDSAPNTELIKIQKFIEEVEKVK